MGGDKVKEALPYQISLSQYGLRRSDQEGVVGDSSQRGREEEGRPA